MSVQLKNINKSFGETKALSNISLNVNEGELFGLIGPDGAGKTTLIRILTTLILPDEGKATICGFDTDKDYKSIRKIVGYMPGKFSLYSDLTVEENINFFAKIFGTTVKENYYLVEDIYSQIEPFKNRQASKLSGGMKQKLALSCALIHKPKVLFLDEPTTGVDPVSRKELWDMLKKLKSEGITIIVSTAYMDEAKLCDRVALIDKGVILSVDTVENIIRSYHKTLFEAKADNMYNLVREIRSKDIVELVYPFGENLHVVMKETKYTPENLSVILSAETNSNMQIQKAEPTIEDCFIDLMGHKHGE